MPDSKNIVIESNIDRKNRVIVLSIKAKEAHEEAAAIEDYNTETGKPAASTTLGDLLKEKMTSE